MKQDLKQLCGTVLFDEPLSRYTSIRIGGPADAFLYPKTIEELLAIAEFCRQRKVPLFVLGSGSNLLVRDKGIRGIVVHLSQGFHTIRIEERGADSALIYGEAGVGIPRLVDFTAEEGLTGMEPLAGIPGNVGGAIVMNAGIPDGDIGSVVENVTFLDLSPKLPKPLLKTWGRNEIRFGYRMSHFPKGSIILSARFRLRHLSSELVRGKVQKYRSERVQTQPLNLPNVGSVFKNPQEKKVYAGRLIEEAGLKDIRVGRARISPKHANFIVNEGGAKAKDVLVLIGLVRDKVKERFGVLLEPEVRVVGEE